MMKNIPGYNEMMEIRNVLIRQELTRISTSAEAFCLKKVREAIEAMEESHFKVCAQAEEIYDVVANPISQWSIDHDEKLTPKEVEELTALVIENIDRGLKDEA